MQPVVAMTSRLANYTETLAHKNHMDAKQEFVAVFPINHWYIYCGSQLPTKYFSLLAVFIWGTPQFQS